MDTRLLALLYQMRTAVLENDVDTLALTLVAAIELSEWSMTIEAQCDAVIERQNSCATSH